MVNISHESSDETARRPERVIGDSRFVVCGQNSDDGGIFDYWGCPRELRDVVLEEVRHLVSRR